MYKEQSKQQVRNEALQNAIRYLTTERNNSTIATQSYLRNAKQALIDKEESYGDIAYELSDDTIERWENFYQSIVTSKEPYSLKIAYLCGPDPLNDLEIMIKEGVLAENVWAFELDNSSYDSAAIETLNSKYPYLKIVKGDISTFFEYTPIKFDIIYFDACAPLPSPTSKTLKSVVSIFKNHTLNSPGALITNFSLPTEEQDKHTRDSISKLVSNYLYYKGFLESNDEEHNLVDGAQTCGYDDIAKWEGEVSSNLDNYYGQYITRFINDIASTIVPYQRFFDNRKFLKIFFENVFSTRNQDSLDDKLEIILNRFVNFDLDTYEGGDIYFDAWLYSTLCALDSINDISAQDSKNKFYKVFLNELSYLKNKELFLKAMTFMYYILDEGNGEEYFYSESLRDLSSTWKPFERHYLCDVFMFHQLKELLIRQLCVPYHLNIEKTDRWTYKAKDTQMFTDLFIFDESRYLYDWIPTLDMLKDNLNNIDMDLSLRLVLDAISKHALRYNNDYFFGTSALDISMQGFGEKLFKIRKRV